MDAIFVVPSAKVMPDVISLSVAGSEGTALRRCENEKILAGDWVGATTATGGAGEAGEAFDEGADGLRVGSMLAAQLCIMLTPLSRRIRSDGVAPLASRFTPLDLPRSQSQKDPPRACFERDAKVSRSQNLQPRHSHNRRRRDRTLHLNRGVQGDMANAGPMVGARLVRSGVMSRSLLTLLLVTVVVSPLTRAHFTGPMPLLMRHGWGLRLRGAGPDSAEIDDDDIGAGEDDMMVRSDDEGITSSLPPEATDNYIPSDDDGDSIDPKFEDENEGSYDKQRNAPGDAMEDMDGDNGDGGSSDTEDDDRVGKSHAWGQDPDEIMDSEERAMVDFMKRLDGKLEVSRENQELFDAAEKGDVARALASIEAGAGINAQTGDVERFSALHIAAMHGHVDLVRTLVDAGADLYLKSGSGDSALHLAAHGGSEEAVSLILSRGVDVNIAGFGDTSPLFNAVETGKLGCVSLLCERGADVNRTDDWSSSPLHLAAMHGHLNICTKLAG